MSQARKSRRSGLPSLPSTTSSYTSQAKPWRTSHEPRVDPRRIQRQYSTIGEDMVLPRLGAFRITDSRLRIPDVKAGIDSSPELPVLLRDRPDGNHRIRLWSRRGSTLRRTRARGRIALFPLSPGLPRRIPGSSSDLWGREHDDQGSSTPSRGSLVCWRSYNSRRRVRLDLDVSPRTRNHRNNGINVVHCIQVR